MDSLDREIGSLNLFTSEFTKIYKPLIGKLDSIDNVDLSTRLKKDMSLCMEYINDQIQKAENELLLDFWMIDWFAEYLCSPLHVASLGGLQNLVKFIIKNKDLVEYAETFEYQCLPIHLAIDKEHFEIVKALLPYTKDLNATYKFQENERLFEMAICTDDMRIVTALLPRIDFNNENMYKLIQNTTVSPFPCDEILKLLITRASVEYHTEWPGLNAPYFEDIRSMISFSKYRPKGFTPLDHLAQKGDLESIKAMTTYDVFTNTFCKSPEIPYAEISERDFEYIRDRATYGMRTEMYCKIAFGQISGRHFNAFIPIYEAIKNGHYELAKYLIGCKLEEGDKPSDPDRFGRYIRKTPIHAAAECGHVKILKLLMKTSDNPNAADANGITPIHLAAEKGHMKVIKILMTATSNPNAPDKIGKTPIHEAAKCGHVEILKLLMKTTDNPNVADANGVTPIHLAAEKGHMEVFKILMTSTNNPNAPDKNGKTPFQLATTNGHNNFVKPLYEEATKKYQSEIEEMFTSMIKTRKGREPNNKKRRFE